MIDDTRVLPRRWVEASWQARGTSPGTGDGFGFGFGFGWFITILADERVYYGRGFGGQALYVIPRRELTVAITANPHPPSPGGQFQQQLHALVEGMIVAD